MRDADSEAIVAALCFRDGVWLSLVYAWFSTITESGYKRIITGGSRYVQTAFLNSQYSGLESSLVQISHA